MQVNIIFPTRATKTWWNLKYSPSNTKWLPTAFYWCASLFIWNAARSKSSFHGEVAAASAHKIPGQRQDITCITATNVKTAMCFWRDVFGLGVLMENKGEILYCNMGKRNRQIWCARIRGVSHVTQLLGNARNAAVTAAVTRQREWRCSG
jgi:hypothetical protein